MVGSFYFTKINDNPNALLGLCIVFIFGFNCGIGSIGMPYLAEICHPYGMGLGQLANWLGVFVVGLLYPYASQEWLPDGETNLIFAGLSLVGLVYLCFNFKETRGKTPEQIQRMFQVVPEQKKLGRQNSDENHLTFGSKEGQVDKV